MTPDQQQLTRELRAAIERKQDPAERALLLEKLALIERHFAEETRLQREAAEADALIRKGKRAIFWGRLAIGALLVAILCMLAWFVIDAVHRL
jgi:ferric-dicitrate binding protein FerR (iron transport regulator)